MEKLHKKKINKVQRHIPEKAEKRGSASNTAGIKSNYSIEKILENSTPVGDGGSELPSTSMNIIDAFQEPVIVQPSTQERQVQNGQIPKFDIQKPFICRICWMSYKNRGGIRTHIWRKHKFPGEPLNDDEFIDLRKSGSMSGTGEVDISSRLNNFTITTADGGVIEFRWSKS